MKKKGRTRERLVEEVRFFLKENQTLYVSPNGLLNPGLSRVFVTRKNGRVGVWAQATSGSRFRFRRGSGARGNPHFQIENPTPDQQLEDFLEQMFWSQPSIQEWIYTYAGNRDFCRLVRRRIKQLVKELTKDVEERTAKELNAIPRPSRK